jgi:cell division protein FtsX
MNNTQIQNTLSSTCKNTLAPKVKATYGVKEIEVIDSRTSEPIKIKLNKEEAKYIKMLQNTHNVYLNDDYIVIYENTFYIAGFRASTEEKLVNLGYKVEFDPVCKAVCYKKIYRVISDE